MRFSLLFLVPTLLFARPGYNEPWGRDAELFPRHNTVLPTPSQNPFTRAFEGFVLLKQKYISPIDGPRSHFRPTSSEYMLRAVRMHGFFKGFIMGCDRLMRENSEEWIYRTTDTDEGTFKYDPVIKPYKSAFTDPVAIE